MGFTITDPGRSNTRKRPSTQKTRSRPHLEKKTDNDAAENVFAAEDRHGVTIADISRGPSVHETSISQYFETKENLLVSIEHEALARIMLPNRKTSFVSAEQMITLLLRAIRSK